MPRIFPPFLLRAFALGLACLAPLILAARPWSAAYVPGTQTRLVVLKNGFSVLITTDPALETAALSFWVRAGGTQERPGRSGVAHLFEHMMLRPHQAGAPTFFEAASAYGAETNAYTFSRATLYVTALLPSDLRRHLALEAARFTRGWVDAGLLELEKGAVRSELNDGWNAPTLNALYSDLRQRAFGDQPASHGSAGRLEDLAGLSLQDCRDYFGAYYTPSNVAAIFTGPLAFEDALAAFEQAFGAWQGPRAPALVEPKAYKAGDLGSATHKLTYPGLMLGLREPGPGLKPGSADDLALHILFYSPWNLAARVLKVERRLVNFLMPYGMAEDADLMACWFSADPGVKAGPVLAGLAGLPDVLEGLSEAQFKAYRDEWILGYREALLAPATLNHRLGQAWSRGGLKELALFNSGQPGPEQKAVVRAARRWLDPRAMAYVRTGMEP